MDAPDPSAANPYAAPLTSHVGGEVRREFAEIPTGDLKKLRNASHTIRTLGVLWLLGIILAFVVAVTIRFSPARQVGTIEPTILLAALFVAGSWGALQRPVWGRLVGIICCCLMGVIFIPLGTILGLLGLVAYGRGSLLFGEHRLHHGRLENEWKYRRRNRVP